MMFTLTAVVAFLATVLYAGGMGHHFDRIGWWERLARLGVAGVLCSAFVGMAVRAHQHDPFLWIHWLLLAALAATCGGYLGLYLKARRNGRPRMD